MKKLNKVQKMATVLGYITKVLNKYSSGCLSNILDNHVYFISGFKDLVKKYSKSWKEIVALQALKDNAKAWGWSQENQDKIGENMKVVSSPKDVWSAPDTELLDADTSKFGKATITAEKPPFDFEDTDKYKVLTEKYLFPGIDFTKEKNRLEAVRKFIKEIDKLNQEFIKNTGKPKYYIPGLEYMDFLHKTDKIPYFMKDDNFYFYGASSFRHHDGDLNMPCSYQIGSSFRRYSFWVSDDWVSNFRFIVLEIL